MKITSAKTRTEIPIPEELRNAEVTVEAAEDFAQPAFIGDVDVSELEMRLEQALIDYFVANGFPADEVMDYSVIDISEKNDEYGRRICVEVRYEPMFDEFELCNALDPVVQQYDEDAYFDLWDAGIADAYIRVK